MTVMIICMIITYYNSPNDVSTCENGYIMTIGEFIIDRVNLESRTFFSPQGYYHLAKTWQRTIQHT